MGESPIPERPTVFFGGVIYLSAFYAFSPWAWQWTGDARHRTGVVRGWIQALMWNLAWLGLLSLLYRLHGGPGLQHIARGMQVVAEQSKLPIELVRLIIQMPFAILVGWFVAGKEASDLDWADSEAARKILEAQERESRNQALLAQLDPHVLYNALGALSELVREDAGRAEEALLDVADFYRRLTRIRDKPFISLAEERSLLEQYLAIEQLRLGSRLSVDWDWPEEIEELRLPPLLVLPLVENAIKHGIAPVRKGGELHIEARRTTEGDLYIRVSNSGMPLSNPDPQGTGLRNLKARLALIAEGFSTLDLRSEGPLTVAELRLEAPAIQGDV
ncbi:MAG: histidine kinase [Holophagaceae bacterium]|nr:histidine kinase [Holophagaceae bacterium]